MVFSVYKIQKKGIVFKIFEGSAQMSPLLPKDRYKEGSILGHANGRVILLESEELGLFCALISFTVPKYWSFRSHLSENTVTS